MTSHRDLGDARLWHASHHRSLERRRTAAARGGLALPSRATTATVAAALSAVALPGALHAAPASAASGLAAVQQALGITADGVMGPQTRRALRRFQREHGLQPDGRAGAATRAALGLDKAAAVKLAGTLRDVQAKLGLDADGVAGPKTRAAIRAFQSAHDLPATGRLDRRTRAAILGGDGAGATVRSAPPAAAPAPQAEGVGAAVDAARQQIGKPYASGGKGPGAFDCSGLTAYVFKQAGISLGASSFAQYQQGTSVAKADIQAGDLVFFDSNGAGASHVGVATGPTTMISATSHGVMENSFTSGYWASHYVGARRLS